MGLRLGVQDPEQWLEDCPDRVADQWQAYYHLEPFGGERELLAKCVSLLLILAMKDNKVDAVLAASDEIVQALMPPGWVGRKERPAESIEQQLATFEQVVSAAFG